MRIIWLSQLLLLLCTIEGYAQSLYDIEGRVIATKINENQLNVTGSIFTLQNGKLIETFDGQLQEDLGVNYTVPSDNKVEYYNATDVFIGYYVPSEQRYYRVDRKRGEEEHVALLYEGLVYTLDEKPSFKIDPGFDPKWIGAVLFFFLGY